MSGMKAFVSSQPQYSMLYRQPEAEVIPLCKANGISQIVWSPLAQGILTGKYRAGSQPPSDSRVLSQTMGGFIDKRLLQDRVLNSIQSLVPIAQKLGLTLTQLALAWVLREPSVASAIIGATKPEQVEENAGASGHKLPDDVLMEIDGIMAQALAA